MQGLLYLLVKSHLNDKVNNITIFSVKHNYGIMFYDNFPFIISINSTFINII